MRYRKGLYGLFIILVSVLGLGFLKTSAETESASEGTEDRGFSISTEFMAGVERVTLYAYESVQEDAWCFALPEGYEDQDLTVHIVFPENGCCDVVRQAGTGQIDVSQDDITYRIRFLNAGEVPSLWVISGEEGALEYLHADKENELSSRVMLLDSDGELQLHNRFGRISGRGNDSWNADKKSYNLSFDQEVDLLGMGSSENYVLLAGYRDNSLLAYKLTSDLVREVGMAYAPESYFVQLYIDGNYMGMYCLTKKIEIGASRFALSDLKALTKKMNRWPLDSYERSEWESDTTHARRIWFELDHTPPDVSGGYILEMDKSDYDPIKSRFVSDRNLSLTLRSMPYASLEQITYIADYWQDFEDALYAEDGVNEKGVHYSAYIDMESFADQWLFYELNMENSLGSSIYFYKDSDLTGDGLLHASYPWDVEHSLARRGVAAQSWFATTRTEKDAYWNQFYRHEDFAELVYEEWLEKFLPALEKALDPCTGENPEGVSSLDWYQNAYCTAGKINSSRWDDCIYEEKLEKIRYIYTCRKDFLTKALSLYEESYAYYYEEDGVFYGVLSSGECETMTWREDGTDLVHGHSGAEEL